MPALSDLVAIGFGTSWRERLFGMLLFIFALVSSIYIIVRSIVDFGDVLTNHTSGHDLHTTVAALFFTCACLGMIFTYFLAYSRTELRSIDHERLHWGRGKKRQSIPWVDVAVLKAEVAKSGKLTSFKVVEAPPKSRTVSWPANAHWVRTPDGVSPNDAGAQFAALVAQRAGIQPTAAWDE